MRYAKDVADKYNNCSTRAILVMIMYLVINANVVYAAGINVTIVELNIRSGIAKIDDYGKVEVTSQELDSLFKLFEIDTLWASYPTFLDSDTLRIGKNGGYLNSNLSNCYELVLFDSSKVSPFFQLVANCDGFVSCAVTSAGGSMASPNDEGFQAYPTSNGHWYAFGATGEEIQEQYGVNARMAWDITTGSDRVLLGHVDSRMNVDYCPLELPSSRKLAGYSSDSFTEHLQQHGYQTLGVIAATMNNGTAVAGINNVSPWVVKSNEKLYNYWSYAYCVFDYTKATQSLQSIVNIAINEDYKTVINNSWGAPSTSFAYVDSPGMRNALRDLYMNDGLAFFAMGQTFMGWDVDAFYSENGHPLAYIYPAAYSDDGLCVAVGGIRQDGAPYGFYQDFKYISAPSDHITPLVSGDELGNPNEAGTSYATAITTGIASLVWSVNDKLNNDDVRNILKYTAMPLDDDPEEYSHTALWGYGEVNAYEAVKFASSKCIAHHIETEVAGDVGQTVHVPDANMLMGNDHYGMNVNITNEYRDDILVPYGIDPYYLIWARPSACTDGTDDAYLAFPQTPKSTSYGIPWLEASYESPFNCRLDWYRWFDRDTGEFYPRTNSVMTLAYTTASNNFVREMVDGIEYPTTYTWSGVVDIDHDIIIRPGVTLKVLPETVIRVATDEDIRITVDIGGRLEIFGQGGWETQWVEIVSANYYDRNGVEQLFDGSLTIDTGDIPENDGAELRFTKILTDVIFDGSIHISETVDVSARHYPNRPDQEGVLSFADNTKIYYTGYTQPYLSSQSKITATRGGVILAEGVHLFDNDNVSIFQGNGLIEVYLGSSADIDGCWFDSNVTSIRKGIKSFRGDIHVYNSLFSNLDHGIYIIGDEDNHIQYSNTVRSSYFRNCEDKAISISNILLEEANILIIGNSITNSDIAIYIENVTNVLRVSSNVIRGSRRGILLNNHHFGLFQENDIDECSAGIFNYASSPSYTGNWVRGDYVSFLSEGSRPVMRGTRHGYNVFVDGVNQFSNPVKVIPTFELYPDFSNGFNFVGLNNGPVVSMKVEFPGSIYDDPPTLPLQNNHSTYYFEDTFWGRNYDPAVINERANVHLRNPSDDPDVLSNWYHGFVASNHWTADGHSYYGEPEQYMDLFDVSNPANNCLQCHTNLAVPSSKNILESVIVSSEQEHEDDYYYRSQEHELCDIGRENLLNAKYSEAYNNMLYILSNSDEIGLKAQALEYMYQCAIMDTTVAFDSDIGNVIDTTKIESLEKLGNKLIAQRASDTGNYTQSIAYYESIITTTGVTLVDSIAAVIGAMGVYVDAAMEIDTSYQQSELSEALQGMGLYGSIASLRPDSYEEYFLKVDELQEYLLYDYRILEYLIDDTTIWSPGSILLEDDVLIESSGVLIIKPGAQIYGDNVDIEVDGKVIIEGTENTPIEFYPSESASVGVNIIVSPGASQESVIKNCNFTRSASAITLREELVASLEKISFKDCTIGIRTDKNYPIEITITDCDFTSSGNFSDLGLDLSKLQEGSFVDLCTFTGAMRPVAGVNSDFKIANCFVDNVDTLTTTSDRSAFDLTYCSGTIAHNTILRYPTGIKLYDSDMIVIENKIEECFQEGVWLQHDSYPDFCSMNWLKKNGESATIPTQMRIEGEIYPFMKGGKNNFWVPKDGYAIVSGTAPSSYTELLENYWGDTNPVLAELFYPYSSKINITPWLTSQQVPAGGYQTESLYEDLYSQALAHMEVEEYESAINCFEQVALNDTTTGLRVGAVSNLLTAYRRSNTPYGELIPFLLTVAETTDDVRVGFEANNTIARANRELADYQPAIEHYESIILDPTTLFEDSIFAVIDAGYTYLEAGGEGEGKRSNGGELYGEIAELRPMNRRVQEQKVAELMSLLRNRTYTVADKVELPTEFVLQPAYPNPFNPSVTVPFGLPNSSRVKVVLYNVLGQRVVTLVDEVRQAGYHRVVWDGRSLSGTPLSSGVYFVKMEAPGFVKTRKIVMIK